jgi:hypothetical protein
MVHPAPAFLHSNALQEYSPRSAARANTSILLLSILFVVMPPWLIAIAPWLAAIAWGLYRDISKALE